MDATQPHPLACAARSAAPVAGGAGVVRWALLLLVASHGVAEAAAPVALRSFAVPGGSRPTAAAYDEQTAVLVIAAAGRRGQPDLHAIALGADGATPSHLWSAATGTKVHAVAVGDGYAYLATAANDAELVVVDLATGARVGVFDTPGRADGRRLDVVAPGVVELGRRRNEHAELYRLDVTDPAAPALLDAIEDRGAGRPPKPASLPRYAHDGRLVARASRAVPRGLLHYLVTNSRGSELQIVEQAVPVSFADVNGDGAYVLGCLGDSNSAPHPMVRWCERLASAIADPDFRLVNLARSGATVNENLVSESDASTQMTDVLGQVPDAVVLAFGTNDVFQGRTAADIVGAYERQKQTADAAGVAVYVATTPPIRACTTPSCPVVLESNALLRERFAGALLEFEAGFDAGHFHDDGVHANEAGQTLRAERALAVLANPALHAQP